MSRSAPLLVFVAGCLFNPAGSTPAGPPPDAAELDAHNGDGGIDSATDALVDTPVDASIDAIGDNTVAIELETPNNVRSGHPGETLVKLVTGTSVLSCDLTSTTPSGAALSGWSGSTIVTSTPFEVNLETGLNTLTATCTTVGGQQVVADLPVRAMYLEATPGGTIAWDAPDVHGADRCTSIAIPPVNGGLPNGGSYNNPDSRPFAPAGNTVQGVACANADGTIRYRATITYVAP